MRDRLWWSVGVLVIASAACSEVTVPLIGKKPAAVIPDASMIHDATLDVSSISDVAVADAPADSPRDMTEAEAGPTLGTGPFGAPTLVAALSDPTADDQDPTFTEDEREIYFMSDRGGGNADIWMSRRDDKTLPWQTPTRVDELSSPGTDNNPCIALDGLTIWITSDRLDAGIGFDLWVSTRATRQDPWSAPQRVVELSSPQSDFASSISEDERMMVFASDRPGGPGTVNIYFSTRANPTAPWGAPALLPGSVNTTDEEWDPFLGANGLQIFWGANRTSAMGEEIGSARRDSIDGAFGNITVLDELGRPSFDPTFSVDLRHVVFASIKGASADIYEAFR